eukprot:gb/GFBE01004223.1/.p1 GENE.gb/GFBE01004223.1/~~gb/GFBE01004223.1/.p1  ORF type:complete len:197 (+),score=42.95 gb/GFBE01004223.1/:1-591(+)
MAVSQFFAATLGDAEHDLKLTATKPMSFLEVPAVQCPVDSNISADDSCSTAAPSAPWTRHISPEDDDDMWNHEASVGLDSVSADDLKAALTLTQRQACPLRTYLASRAVGNAAAAVSLPDVSDTESEEDDCDAVRRMGLAARCVALGRLSHREFDESEQFAAGTDSFEPESEDDEDVVQRLGLSLRRIALGGRSGL